MSGRVFDPLGWIWKPFGWIGDIFIASCLWFVCSVPLFTVGTATTALYDCMVHCTRQNDGSVFSRFFRTFKREFKTATLATLVWAAVIILGYCAIRLFGDRVAPTDSAVVVTVAALALLTVAIGVVCWVFPLLSRFTFSLGSLNTTAVKLALSHMPATLALGILTALSGYLCAQFWLPFVFLPGITALLWSFLLEPVFQKYM